MKKHVQILAYPALSLEKSERTGPGTVQNQAVAEQCKSE